MGSIRMSYQLLLVVVLLGFGFEPLYGSAVELAEPPADARKFLFLSSAGKHGDAAIWTTDTGLQVSRDNVLLRGQVWVLEQTVRIGSDGMPIELIVRGSTPQGNADESFAINNRAALWKSPSDSGSAEYVSPAFYVSNGGTFSGSSQLLLEAVLAANNRRLSLLPAGLVEAEELAKVEVGEGDHQKMVVAWALIGLSNTPLVAWATQDGKFFGQLGGISLLPIGYENSLKKLEATQDNALAVRSGRQAKAILKPSTSPVAFTNVRAFVEGNRFIDNQTVIVDKGLITYVGHAGSPTIPKETMIIDGTGKTLVPGLWDCHMHVKDDSTGVMLLSLGITSIRDPGNSESLTLARAKRRAKGELLSPHVYPSMLIDGKGPNSAQSGVVVTSVAGAHLAIKNAKAHRFTGIKFYGSYAPTWVRPAAAHAHKLGLRVHGHLPAGMRPSQAIAAGYDEITHIYFVILEAMPSECAFRRS